MGIDKKNQILYERFMEREDYGAAMEIGFFMGDYKKIVEAGTREYKRCLEKKDIRATILYGIRIGKSFKEIERDLHSVLKTEKERKGATIMIKVLEGRFP